MGTFNRLFQYLFGSGNRNQGDSSVVYEQSSTPKNRRRNLLIIGIIIAAAFVFIGMYFMYVPLNIRAQSFWIMIFAVSLPLCITIAIGMDDQKKRRIVGLIPAAILVALIIAGICGTKLFHAHAYASVITIQDADFEEDLQETVSTDSIALMDTNSAKMLGDREIGTLSQVVSQYNVSTDYSQIDYQGSPQKVAALEYAGFWKWFNNRKKGTPGYITVDPVSMSASYQPLEDEGMIYVPSAYFFQTAERRIYFHYPTKIKSSLHFEIDEEGNPYYVSTVYKPTIGLFQAKVPVGAIIMDPITGDMEYYSLDEVPTWVDIVYTGSNLCDYYNWYGLYSNGFWNSLFGKQGCKQITTYSRTSTDDDPPAVDYGYVAKDGDIWIYTGITSINNDSSNIGFILANERTGEVHYYTIAGADEQSAMNAAEGEVQEKGYQASFPSLINVDGTPTYIMVLKDASGLVKQYATVNVEQYNIVATASTQQECINKYRALIGTEMDLTEYEEDLEEEDSDSAQGAGGTDAEVDEDLEEAPVYEADITIAAIQFIDIGGNTYCYLITEDSEIYRIRVSDHEEILLVQVGDDLHITYQEGLILTWEEEP